LGRAANRTGGGLLDPRAVVHLARRGTTCRRAMSLDDELDQISGGAGRACYALGLMFLALGRALLALGQALLALGGAALALSRWLGARLGAFLGRASRHAAVPAWARPWCLDALGALLAAHRRLGLEVSAACTVTWDPLGRSRRAIPLGGVDAYDAFKVTAAPSERARRAVAWFYRWHDAPDDDDWRRCLARFGLSAVPAPFTIKLRRRAPYGAGGAADKGVGADAGAGADAAAGVDAGGDEGVPSGPPPREYLTIEELILGADGAAGSRRLSYMDGGRAHTVSGPTPLGGHLPRSYVRAVAHSGKAA
jgi:hypothetical protein